MVEAQSSSFLNRFVEARKTLEDDGVVVINNVIPIHDCDAYISQYQAWLAKYKGGFPEDFHSITSSGGIHHLSATWRVRLQLKSVFAALWNTEKLLSSVDCVSVGRPPELGETKFDGEETPWLHVDQGMHKIGQHAVQGAVYLEDADHDDWCLQVLKGSHKYFEEMGDLYPYGLRKGDGNSDSHDTTPGLEHHLLGEQVVQWYLSKGCTLSRIPVRKGGVVLWDSRTVHHSAQPQRGRKHPSRWRYVVFVCMGPAAWATEKDLKVKRVAYENMQPTAHWPCREVFITNQIDHDQFPCKELPDIAKSEEVCRLAGVLPYDFNDGTPNGPPIPQYRM